MIHEGTIPDAKSLVGVLHNYAGGFNMATVAKLNELALQISKLSSQEQMALIRLVPQLLKTDEEFIVKRRKDADKDFIEGKTVDAYQGISTLKSKK